MRIGLYSPYFPKHFGGGEKHFLTTAWYLSQKHAVDILIPSDLGNISSTLNRYEQMFDLDLSKIHLVPSKIADRTSNSVQTWWQTLHYDAFVYLTDGSLFFSGSQKNILHLQFPFDNHPKSLISKLKLHNWNIKNANSEFTRQAIEKNWSTKVDWLHYPYTKLPNQQIISNTRAKIILSVGRFVNPADNVGHSKRQDLLIEAFKTGRLKHGWTNWKLILVGSIEPDQAHHDYVTELKKSARGLPVEFQHDISQARLNNLYANSSIFWHAAGFDIDEQTHPKQVEHFGMSTLEAQSYGVIPIVVPKGGLKELINQNKNGYFFQNETQLIENTQKIMELSGSEQLAMRQTCYQTASQFSLEVFCDTIERMLRA